MLKGTNNHPMFALEFLQVVAVVKCKQIYFSLIRFINTMCIYIYNIACPESTGVSFQQNVSTYWQHILTGHPFVFSTVTAVQAESYGEI